jgi:ribosomal protein L21E
MAEKLKATVEKRRLLEQYEIGDIVTIINVAQPDMESHNRFIGQSGPVARVLKGRCEVVVDTPVGRRYCNPKNIILRKKKGLKS